MRTATATCGFCAGAKAMNHACVCCPGVFSAVPVLPATATPGICAAVPVPAVTTDSIICVNADATSGRTAWPSACGFVVDNVDKSGASVFATRYGCMTRPPLPMAAATIAICKGVTASSYCPIAENATCGGGMSDGNTLGATDIGIFTDEPNPKASACRCSALAPSLRPRPPNAVLQETRSASARVIWPPPLHCSPSKFCNLCVVCGRDSWLGAGSSDDGV